MKYQNKRLQNKHKRLRIVAIVALVLVLIAAVVFALEKTKVINLYERTPEAASDTPKTTSDVPSAQEDFTSDEERTPGNTLNENAGYGDVVDNNGNIGNVDTASPLVSKTGEISVYTPRTDGVISTKQQLAGKSSLPKVSYRLIDSVTGVIASGELNVVNGNFSGSIVYTTSAKEGRLDIFGTREDFSEFSNIEVPIRFMQ